jgi:hypothetical protein
MNTYDLNTLVKVSNFAKENKIILIEDLTSLLLS